MASPAVAARNTSAVTSAGTSHTVNLPASISAGDLLTVNFGTSRNDAVADWTGTGFTAVSGAAVAGSGGTTLDIAYRWADGSEGATITVSTGAVSTKSAHSSYRITGAENPATQPPEAGTGATGTTGSADPPSVAGTGGSKDYLFIAVGVNQQESSFSAFPANYVNGIQADTGTIGTAATNCDLGSAERQLTAASDDPGAFTYGTSGNWTAQTIVIHPAGAPPAGGNPYPYLGGGYYPTEG